MRAFETRYRNELDWLCFTPAQKAEIAQNVAQAVEEQAGAQRGKRGVRRGLIVAVAAVLMAAISFGAVASISQLSPSEAAAMFMRENARAAKAFSGISLNGEEPEYQLGDCMVRLCGVVTDEAVLDEFGCTMEDGHTYVMLSYRHTNGTAFDINKEYGRWTMKSVFVSGIPIEAQPIFVPRRYATEADGILYELFDCTSVGLFADHTVYLAIYDIWLTDLYEQKFGKREERYGLVGAGPEDAIKMDEDGSYAFLPDYPKEHLLIELPLDESLADPERAQEYLNSWQYYQDWINQTGIFESGYTYDPQCLDDILEMNRPYEERGYVPLKYWYEDE